MFVYFSVWGLYEGVFQICLLVSVLCVHVCMGCVCFCVCLCIYVCDCVIILSGACVGVGVFIR